MLQACRMLSPVRGVVVFRPCLVQRLTVDFKPACAFSTGCPGLQKTDMLEDLRNIKNRKKSNKNKKLTSGVISVDNEGFQELKARVIKLRAEQLDLLGGHGGRDVNTENPADIIPSCLKKLPFSCEKCGRGFIKKAGLSQHTRANKCMANSSTVNQASDNLLLSQSYRVDNLQEMFSTENMNSEHSRNEVSEVSLNPFLETESSIAPSSIQKEYKCDSCETIFTSKSSLTRHRTKSKTCANSSSKLVEFRCECCGNTFATHQNLMRHNNNSKTCRMKREAESGNRDQVLGTISTDETTRLEDVSKLSSPAPSRFHECEFCKKDFKTISALSVHKLRSKKCLVIRKELEVTDSAFNEANMEEILITKLYSEEEEGEEVDIEPSTEFPEQSYREIDIEDKQEILVAYFDTLVNTNRTQAAYEDFKLIKSDVDGKDYVESIAIYDKLLRGFARKNDFAKIQEVWKGVVIRGLQPTLNSYISAMMSFDTCDESKNVFRTLFKQVYADFTSAGFTVEEALKSGEFIFDDKKRFIKVVSKFVNNQDNLANSTDDDDVILPLLADLNAAGSSNLKSHLDTVLDRPDLNPLLKRQLEMETSQTVNIPAISNKSKYSTQKFREFTHSLESTWRARVSKALAWKMSLGKKFPFWKRGSTINMHQFLSCVPLEQLTDIILATATANMNENYSRSVTHIISDLGNDVMTAYHINLKCNDSSSSWSDYVGSLNHYYDWYCEPQNGSPNHRTAIHSVTGDLTLEHSLTMWPRNVRMAVGGVLFQVLLDEIQVDVDTNGRVITDSKVIDSDGLLSDPLRPFNTNPAFFKIFRKRKDIRDVQELKPNPSLAKVFEANSMVDLQFPATDMPMLVPPLPWVSVNTGGYLVRDSKLIKVPDSTRADQETLISSLPPGGLNPIVDSINQLSSVPWIVNKPVLELASALFLDQSDHSLLGQTELPLHPDHISPPTLSPDLQDVLADRARLTQEQVDEYKAFLQERSMHTQVKSESYSLWCSTLYRLSLASHFQNEVLWFPHNVDFRGRCYPLPPQLNHMGADLSRSLLVFAKGKKLGKEGFTWLKLHLINLTGAMKRESIADRLEYADSILPKILQSATSPLEGERFWLESDDPWQTYSACLEVKRALEHPGGPEEYTCHLPIHQDGSCNGLQHYAALGRDLLGARAVNLVPADKPQDVYSEIAAIVDRKRQEDSQAGLEIATALEGFVRRKVVKQTVMTTVYGVTKYGATLQIKKQLKDTDDFPVELIDQAGKYLSLKTFESLNEMFTASQLIQDWFTECATVISRDCQSNVSWVTPLGFPVIQPYSRMVTQMDKNISMDMTNMFKLHPKSKVVKKETEVKINTMKNKNGFAPNFIHSLDSSHMMLTSLQLWSQGITYASVHDCFWTHASDVEAMNRACREQFIALHSSPILEQLSEHFMENYLEVQEAPLSEGKKVREKTLEKRRLARGMERRKREMLFNSLPKKGELDLGVIHDSTFFFS
eukprot:GFUD01019377.1.p1 GENE.GFUD01019377.1~~GFUD01019377.1.p1  ORF type:complete len:1482 (+),score=337.24 GFUD01019377.1:704-5149(+)